MKTLVLLLVLSFFSEVFAFDQNHTSWTKVLNSSVDSKGLVSYKLLKKESGEKESEFSSYLSTLQKVTKSEFEKWSKQDQMAFLINAYNAFTLKLIVDNYPIESIKKVGGFFTKAWDVKFFKLLDGEIESLDPIEHKWLRPKYKDYRIHAAVNCASISCPQLRNEAFVGSKLDAQLDQQMKVWVNDTSRNSIDFDKKTISISKIFDWYKEDFISWGGGVKEVISKYLEREVAITKDWNVKYLTYDWDLNEKK